MLLFTSNFNSKHSWVMTWVLVLGFYVLILGFYESKLKDNGFKPSIESNKNLWSWYRSNINHKNDIVIIGASRSQIDINIPYLKQKFKHNNITQLSINGHYPLATLKELAEDVNFNGTLLASLNGQAFEEVYFDMQKDYNDYYKNKSSYYLSLDAYLTAYFQSKFRFLNPLISLEKIIKHYELTKSFIKVFYTTMNLDLSISADYSKTNKTALVKHFVSNKKNNYINQPPTEPQLWVKNISKILNYVSTIEKRGGKVVFIRFPTDKGHWKLDEEFYPRSLYWDKIKGVSTVHFKDIKGVGKIDLPDSSHMDAKDTVKFTKLLFDYLLEHDYFKH